MGLFLLPHIPHSHSAQAADKKKLDKASKKTLVGSMKVRSVTKFPFSP